MIKRNKSNKMLGGVCSGIARHMDIDPAIVRLAFVLGAIFCGLTFWIYIAAWLILEED